MIYVLQSLITEHHSKNIFWTFSGHITICMNWFETFSVNYVEGIANELVKLGTILYLSWFIKI